MKYLKDLIAELMDEKEANDYHHVYSCLRPVCPDDLPIIGSLKLHPNVFVNGGHAGRGTTYGLGTSKLVTELLMEGKPKIVEDASLYSPRRF